MINKVNILNIDNSLQRFMSPLAAGQEASTLESTLTTERMSSALAPVASSLISRMCIKCLSTSLNVNREGYSTHGCHKRDQHEREREGRSRNACAHTDTHTRRVWVGNG